MKDDENEGRSTPSRIVIADDHPLVRDGLRQMLNGRSDIELVGEAIDGQEALELCRRLRPDLILMDVRMPRMDGIEATCAIKKEFPRTIVLILTAHVSQNYLLEALKAGAGGYVLKHATSQQLIHAIRKALMGESPLNQELAMGLLLRLMNEAPKEESSTDLAPGKPSEERSEPALLEPLRDFVIIS